MNTRESDFWNERAGPRIAPEHFGDIVATAADLALLVSEGGTIVSVTSNPLNSALGQMGHWEGRKIAEFLAPDSEAKVARHLRATLDETEGRPDSIEVNHMDGAIWDFPVRYTMHRTGRDGRVLMLGRDMRPVAELQQRLVRAQMALEKDYEAQRIFETRYRVLLEAAHDALALIDVESGRVTDINAVGARVMGSTRPGLTGSAFAAEFEGRKRAEFIDALCRSAEDASLPRVTAALRRDGGEVAFAPTLFRNAGERMLLCRIVPAEDGTATVPDAMSGRMADLFRDAGEGIVLTDDDFRIDAVNDAFATMMDAGSATDLRGRSMVDMLARGSVDLKTLTEGDAGTVQPTRLVTRFGAQLAVEVSAASLNSGGHAFLLREQGPMANLRADADDAAGLSQGGPDAAALVGSAPLRDIVASMTDTIERQCIEAAVELTDNNRVAAAEMLGLSRQSLYVKLRKYGLLARDEP